MKFDTGVALQCVAGPAPIEFYADVGRLGVISITVVMENGQMAGVPWALVKWDTGKEVMVNLALMESAELFTEKRIGGENDDKS